MRKQKLGGYSGGMRQRFGIAVALLGNPGLLIVDEPTAGLDPAARVRFLNLLSELGENRVVVGRCGRRAEAQEVAVTPRAGRSSD